MVTISIQECASAKRSASSEVPSVEPSSTMTHADGCTVCSTRQAASRGRFLASFLAGVTIA